LAQADAHSGHHCTPEEIHARYFTTNLYAFLAPLVLNFLLNTYTAIGRALYRWSQLEATVCALAASIQDPSWLEAVKDLRGRHGFKVKNVFQQLKATARKRASSEPTLDDLDRAENLYSARKILFHSVWGHVSGAKRVTVGIQEWSNDSYDNFRYIELEEIETFASECASASESLMKTGIPLFHGAPAIVVDDGDGLTKGH
jgi:hypothetical protein